MSGVELIVGTVLASVPITLEVYDRSGRVFEVFGVVKHYPREALTFKTMLDIQRTIFRNNAIHLLTVITKDRSRVQDVIKQPSSESATHGLVMAPIYRNRLDALEESFESCGQVANHIRVCLEIICSRYDEFAAEVGTKRDDMSYSTWLKHVKTRFKLGLQKPQISKTIEELRNLNKDFVLITEQITRVLEEAICQHSTNVSGGTGRRQVKSLNALQRYHRVRQASQALYSTVQLNWVCKAHRCHSFDVRILDFDTKNGKDKGKSPASIVQCVSCELAITHTGSSSASRVPLRLEVEQACEANDEGVGLPEGPDDAAAMGQLATVLEKNMGRLSVPTPAPPLVSQSIVATSKARRFFKMFHKGSTKKNQQQQAYGPLLPQPASELPVLPESLAGLRIDGISGISDPAGTSPTAAMISPELSSAEDYCRSFKSASTARSLLRSFNVPHSQWFSVPQGPDALHIQSLSDQIRWIAEEPILRSPPRRLLVDVASNVAEGIMQFYSTPWLASSDLGQHVRYLQCQSPIDSGAQLVSGPYFSTRIEGGTYAKSKIARGRIDAPGELTRSTMGFDGVRNKLLFSFGVLLLEVGYGRPWEELKCAVVAQRPVVGGSAAASRGGQAAAARLSDYQAAEKLAQRLVDQMGMTYSSVVKKCLGCDFGLGETDLDNEDLQRRFVEDVISALKQLREDMKEMEL
ncbi:hypothetical protein V8F33_006918 [Rhypophila sp. PSN 637]